MSEGALLKLFKEQLERESEKIGSERELSKRGDFFIWWYFKAIKGYSEEKILEIICDGGGDLGIDVVDINESNVVHFYQFKHPQALEKDIDGTDIDKLISGLHFITKGDYSSVANQELKERLDEIKQAIPSGYVVHVVTSSIAKISVESSKKMDTLIDSEVTPCSWTLGLECQTGC